MSTDACASHRDLVLTTPPQSLTGRVIVLETQPQDTVGQLKEQVEASEGIPPAQQRFLFEGRQLDDEATLAATGVSDGSELHLVLSLRGGSC